MREGAFTDSADKEFLSCVSSNMYLQVTSLGEGAFTDSAGKRLRSCVRSVMFFQLTWCKKLLVTSETPVLHGGQWSGDYWCVKIQGVKEIFITFTFKINKI